VGKKITKEEYTTIKLEILGEVFCNLEKKETEINEEIEELIKEAEINIRNIFVLKVGTREASNEIKRLLKELK